MKAIATAWMSRRFSSSATCAHGAFVEREPHDALDVHALGHREAERARHERRRLFEEHVVLVVAALVGDLDDVAETFGRDQRGAGALALDDGVGRERGAVQEHADVARSARPASARTARVPSTTAFSGARGVVSTFIVSRRSPASRTMSVNVPPMSAASRTPEPELLMSS